MAKTPKKIPFDFVIEYLFSAEPVIKQIFGCHSIYVHEKIVLCLRDKDDDDSGVWIGTSKPHHESLKKELPSMRSIRIFGPGPSGWQVIPKDADDFEESVTHACDLILKKDPRIGNIPKPRKKKTSK